MNRKTRLYFCVGAACLILTAVIIALVKLVDVQPIGPENSVIGLAGINGAVRDLFAFNSLFDVISDVTLIIAFASAFVFVCMGMVQLVKRKGLLKVDKDLYLIGGVFVLLIAVYALFEIITINFRPIIEAGEGLEASFPSTHVFITLSVVGIVLHQLYVRMPSGWLKSISLTAAICTLVIGLISRIVSGVHWITDIIGAVLISGVVIFAYIGAYNYLIERKINK